MSKLAIILIIVVLLVIGVAIWAFSQKPSAPQENREENVREQNQNDPYGDNLDQAIEELQYVEE